MKSLVAGVVAAACVLVGRPEPRAADSLSDLLDVYVQGRFDEAVAAAARLPSAEAAGREIANKAPAWIDSAPPRDRDRRRLAVAAFVLEMTEARMDDDWRVLSPLLEWACALLRNGGPPTEGERQWHLGVIAVAGRARDFGRLTPLPPLWTRMTVTRSDSQTLHKNLFKSGHLAHTARRFPGEPRTLLATTMMAVSLYDVEAPRHYRDGAADPVAAFQRRGLQSSLVYLETLHAEPALAAEADMRAGYAQFAFAGFAKALALERSAAEAARDPETRYLAHFLAGRALVAMKRNDEAAGELRKALDARPRAQSAALLLAALRTATEQTPAFDLLRPSLDSHRIFDDPWRLFAYGDYVRWPDTRAAIREALE
jgi:tetratricopeptide (TPR) repeat protein